MESKTAWRASNGEQQGEGGPEAGPPSDRLLARGGRLDQLVLPPVTTAVATPQSAGPAVPMMWGGGGSSDKDPSGETAKAFPNGDSYQGQRVGGVPHGVGVYRWRDGSVYEGEWQKGVKHGRGAFVWPSGAKYWGDWVDGQMQGLGSYWGVDRSFYTGNWVRGLKHGLGRKRYPNGDTYEGFWSAGNAEGTGRYQWANGNVYIGDWAEGTMAGYGTFQWASGDVFEGEWEAGFEHGHGLFIWQEGSMYEGNWSHGLKDGKGTYYPAGFRNHPAPVAAMAATAAGSAQTAAGASPERMQFPSGVQALVQANAESDRQGSGFRPPAEETQGSGLHAQGSGLPPLGAGSNPQGSGLPRRGRWRNPTSDEADARESLPQSPSSLGMVSETESEVDGEDPPSGKSVRSIFDAIMAAQAVSRRWRAAASSGENAKRVEKFLTELERGKDLWAETLLPRNEAVQFPSGRLLGPAVALPTEQELLGGFEEEHGGGARQAREQQQVSGGSRGAGDAAHDDDAGLEEPDRGAPSRVQGSGPLSLVPLPQIREEENSGSGSGAGLGEGLPGGTGAVPAVESGADRTKGLSNGEAPAGAANGAVVQVAGTRVGKQAERDNMQNETVGLGLHSKQLVGERDKSGGGERDEDAATGAPIWKAGSRSAVYQTHPTLKVPVYPKSLSDSGYAHRSDNCGLRGNDESGVHLSGTLLTGPMFLRQLPSPQNSPSSDNRVVIREYVHGILVSETYRDARSTSIPKRPGPKPGGKKTGEIIYKGHRSYDLMLTLQLGLQYSVGKINQEAERELQKTDFGGAATNVWFPSGGSQLTPTHNMQSFRWKDYCPHVFRHLRRLFGVDPSVYLNSLSGLDALRELSSPGKSGSVFYLSHDDRFIIKTMRRSEVEVLLRMLQAYHSHVQAYPNTLLTRFFGLHRVKIHHGHKVRFVVMGNLLKCDLPIHRRFDLKGSSQGRSTDKVEIDETTTLKDLDLDLAFDLHDNQRPVLQRQIAMDCAFLKAQHIMDYSLLLGLHFQATAPPPPPVTISETRPGEGGAEAAEAVSESEGDRRREAGGGVDGTAANDGPAEEKGAASAARSFFPWNGWRQPAPTAGGPGGGNDGPPPDPPTNEDSAVPPFFGTKPPGMVPSRATEAATTPPVRAHRTLGQGMRATAMRLDRRTRRPITDPQTAEAYEVVLYFGIIDILQVYNLGKQIEHICKSWQYSGDSISSVEPRLYADRFQHFVETAFPDGDALGPSPSPLL